MQYYTEDLIHEINKTEDINFIAVAETYLHAIGINAYIRKAKETGIEIKGFILVLAHRKTGRILKELDFETNGTKITVIEYAGCYRDRLIKPIVSIVDAIKKSKENTQESVVNILWTRVDYCWYEIFSNVNKFYQLCFVKIDDGDGSYINPFVNECCMIINENKDSYIKKIEIISVAFVFYLLKKILIRNLVSKGRFLDYRIFNVNDNKYIPNSNIVKYYQKAFASQGRKIDEKITKKCENAIIINTQCLVENNMSDGKSDFELYKCVTRFAKELDLKIVIKPHPREMNVEKYNKLGVDIIPAKIIQEAIIATTEKKPVCVVGIFSSTLLNANGIFDIPAMSLAKIFLNSGVPRSVRKQVNDYVKRFENIFIFPESMEEAYLMLEKFKVEQQND